MKAPFKRFYLVQEWAFFLDEGQSLSILMTRNKGKYKENLKFQNAVCLQLMSTGR
jgi:hypothetical protein